MISKRLEPHVASEASWSEHAMCQSGEAVGGQAHVCSAGDQAHKCLDVAADTGTGPGLPEPGGLPGELQ